jgi:RNA 3'-terminal phosphate cyclase
MAVNQATLAQNQARSAQEKASRKAGKVETFKKFADASFSAGQGVTVSVKDNVCTISFSLNGDFGPSSSGKTNIVATTSGNVEIPGTGIKVGVNCFKKA